LKGTICESCELLYDQALEYTDQEIFQSGLSKPLEEAQRRRKLLTTKAISRLQELGVSKAKVEKLVEESIKRLNH
jgi:hypothetical protein